MKVCAYIKIAYGAGRIVVMAINKYVRILLPLHTWVCRYSTEILQINLCTFTTAAAKHIYMCIILIHIIQKAHARGHLYVYIRRFTRHTFIYKNACVFVKVDKNFFSP